MEVAMMIDFNLILNSIPYLLQGLKFTLAIAAIGCFIGITFGTLLAIIQTGDNRFLRGAVSLYVTLFRGTPMLIQIAFAVFVLPQLGISLPDFWAATIAIGLNSSAYLSQIIRAGISSIAKGQIEAGRVLGLTQFQITRYIVLPQAVRMVMPALGNEFITLIKDSSLASTVGVMELSKQAMMIRSRTFDAISVYFAVAIIYLLLTSTLSLFMSYLERRMNRHARH
jgi:polar amino acid transport system permease protein